jgi:hypothetical protein
LIWRHRAAAQLHR